MEPTVTGVSAATESLAGSATRFPLFQRSDSNIVFVGSADSAPYVSRRCHDLRMFSLWKSLRVELRKPVVVTDEQDNVL